VKNTSSIKLLAVDINVFGTPSKIYPVLIWDEAGATLVDVGYPGHFEQLKQAVEQAGVPFNQIRRIIITHQDWDHIGTLGDILNALGDAVEIYTHIAEKPYIEGTIPYIKINPERIATRLQSIPAVLRANVTDMFARIPTVQVHHTIKGGETLPFHGGLKVIHTPGHTPGHICLFVKDHRLLIAGDQLRIEQGVLVGPAEEHTPDMPTALKSLYNLTEYDINYVACYHGGLYGPNASARITELANDLNTN
jgi:glyoxylase-like metal-dependent hydrolase (beta-lactamase superfamily II)